MATGRPSSGGWDPGHSTCAPTPAPSSPRAIPVHLPPPPVYPDLLHKAVRKPALRECFYSPG